MLITPANGCGSAISVPDTDIVGQWALVDPTTETSNDRYWPYAAMDYYIQLEVSPDVSALTETVILAGEGNSAATCTAPGSNMLTFSATETNSFELWGFSILVCGNDVQYHGYLCAIPTIGSTTTYTDATDWSSISADETCLDATNTHPLTLDHVIGTSSSSVSSDIFVQRYAWLKVFEAHCTSLDASGNCVNTYCSAFSSVTNEGLSISVRLKEDVAPQLNNLCPQATSQTIRVISETLRSRPRLCNLPILQVYYSLSRNRRVER